MILKDSDQFTNHLLNTQETDVDDRYFILKDFKSYAAAQKRVEEGLLETRRLG